MSNFSHNTQKDPIFNLIKQEETRQAEGLELIPSENYVSANVLKAMGSIKFQNKSFQTIATMVDKLILTVLSASPLNEP